MARTQSTPKSKADRRAPPWTYRGIVPPELPPSRLPIEDIERAVADAFAKHAANLALRHAEVAIEDVEPDAT